MKYLSLFSGIGGFEKGIQQAYENIKSREHLQGSERISIQSKGDKSNIKSWSNKQSETRGDRKLQQPKNIGYSEIDKYAIQQTQHNFPDTIQIGSVTDVKAKDLPHIDLLIGGSPCTGFSFAGKGLNFNDPQSKLFFEYVRILKEIQEYGSKKRKRYG